MSSQDTLTCYETQEHKNVEISEDNGVLTCDISEGSKNLISGLFMCYFRLRVCRCENFVSFEQLILVIRG